MPKHNHVQTEQTSPNTNQQQAGDSHAETTNTEPLIGSLCPWTKYENSVIDHARVSEWELSHARRTASGLHGVLRVLDAHRDSVCNEDQPLLNENIEGALFDAATQLLNDLENQLEGWAEVVKREH